MSRPDPRLDVHDLGPGGIYVVDRNPTSTHARSHVSRRRVLQPIHVLLAGLLGVALGFLIAHATLAASRGAAQAGSPRPATPAAHSAGPGLLPEAPQILEPVLTTPSSAPRPAVELPDPELVTITPRPVVVQPPSHGATGPASWYDWRPGEAAAGPALRVGAWRGRLVTVCASRCIQVRLTDFCGCPGGRVIDLDDASFRVLAPLSRGIVDVRVTW